MLVPPVSPLQHKVMIDLRHLDWGRVKKCRRIGGRWVRLKVLICLAMLIKTTPVEYFRRVKPLMRKETPLGFVAMTSRLVFEPWKGPSSA